MDLAGPATQALGLAGALTLAVVALWRLHVRGQARAERQLDAALAARDACEAARLAELREGVALADRMVAALDRTSDVLREHAEMQRAARRREEDVP